jgi:D-beta-D-heptose 7-phosphate kinase/D-beta-D-heptose 1-phosphate adenosyltransferase
MEEYRKKIKDLSDLKKDIERLKAQGKRIVFTNGCFDLLHPGHTRYLYAARQLGDYLVVAVNTDRSVKIIKGASRPIQSQDERMELLAALSFVDAVVLFDEDNPLSLIEHLVPNVLVKGGDWTEDRIIGADVVRKAGGVVKSLPFVTGYSTTALIEKMGNRKK